MKVSSHLEDLLASAAFSSSPRCQEFLRFVVTQALAGAYESIKERTIATAVFRKPDTYDPTEDSTVRVRAIEVRRRLAQYYLANPDSPVRIALPAGGYIPVFVSAGNAPTEQTSARSTAKTGRWRGWWWKITAVVALVCAIGIAGRVTAQNDADPVGVAWKPLLTKRERVLIGMPAASPLYYTGKGAAFGAARTAALLASHGVPFDLKLGREITFDDLRKHPAVLFGANPNFWTVELMSELPFQFVGESSGREIIDTQTGKRWSNSRKSARGQAIEDYAIAGRILESRSGQLLFLAAGLTAQGTQAAAEFLTAPQYFARFASQAPQDWPKKNFEVVLRAELHSGTPGLPQVIAYRVW